MSSCCSVCNRYPCPGCLGAAWVEVARLSERVKALESDLHAAISAEREAEVKAAASDHSPHFVPRSLLIQTEKVIDAVRTARFRCLGPNVPAELRALHEAMCELDWHMQQGS